MARINQLIKKNLLLLLRSRSSAFVILFGPLVIILLIGLAFTTSSSTNIAVGYHAPQLTPLTERFVQNMEHDGFVIESFTTIDECVETIKMGTVQTCILFPDDFAIENDKTNIITFYVDSSRANFVYQIIDSVSTNLGVETAELSKNLTTSVLDVLDQTNKGIVKTTEEVVKLKAKSAAIASKTTTAADDASSMDLEMPSIDTGEVTDAYDELESDMQALESKGQALVTASKTFEDELDGYSYASDAYTSFKTAVTALSTALGTASDSRESDASAFSDAIDALESSLNELEAQLVSAADIRDATIQQLNDVQTRANEIKDGLDTIKSSLEGLSQHINALSVTSSETISNPITTRIEQVSEKSSKLSFMFPYLLMLVAMFVGLLLSGTLIIMEKRSKSSFRTFCTPVKEQVLLFSNFLTSFIIVIVQLAVILGIAYYFIPDVLVNIQVSAVIIGLGVIFFILLGMALGYLLSSQEAVTMISIALASVFLFLSNLILPLETLSQQLQRITSYNPFVLTSEALRKALLFQASYQQLEKELVLLVSYGVGMLIILLIARSFLRSRFSTLLTLGTRKYLLEDPSALYLKIDGQECKNLEEFLSWLEDTTDATWAKEVQWKVIRSWMKKNRMRKWLRVRLAGASDRKAMIKIIDREVEKHK